MRLSAGAFTCPRHELRPSVILCVTIVKGGPACTTEVQLAVYFPLRFLYILYWVIRLAVRHTNQDVERQRDARDIGLASNDK